MIAQCDECGKDIDQGRWSPAPGYHRIMRLCQHCAEPIKTFATQQEAFDARAELLDPPRSPVYYHAECGCELRDDEKVKWCAHHVSGMQETIKAREREATDLRYRVRELEAEVGDYHRHALHVEAERDEWKAKAEHYHDVARLNYHDITNATHYCCMHMRWETREGVEV